ncbi:DNA polymerase IV [Tissierella pigra]|uniref:DNA polymerase IV n=1 Tax=Tissierella pigra TaxID=2607614 RepID=A0A6N7XMJ5_9FIRM|nr:DNA polymerase IV [Tissierella pigra]MBU5426315.1 DNA polymerase IV [Tissierella pigra]MSU02736.1 DNA polymerase IV [Tissierella pigra]
MTLNIIHVDMDAFYAAVEEEDNPKLKGLPVIVGGLSNHGIVTTANYEARKYGIHSAMPIFMAKQRCPKGFYISPRMKRYQEVSKNVFNILYEFTDLIEQVSIDEAYLDISHIDLEPLKLVEEMKYKVQQSTGLTMSVGISYNKFLAKLASDWNKPNGIKIITKEMVPNILLPLPIRKVHGVGPKSARKLNGIGIYTVEDLLGLTVEFLEELFGKSGREIYDRIRGIDNREINTNRERKSLGVERTFEEITDNKEVLINYLKTFSEELSYDLKSRNIQGRTITVKIKDENFIVQTRSKTLNEYINDLPRIFDMALELLNDIELDSKIRLLGVTASNLITSELEQLSLFD